MDTPTFTVGITGHRPNRLAIGEARVARRLALVLAALRHGSRGCRRIALSALAEGADRLFAVAAQGLGYKMHALLPFASAEYETTFGDGTTTPHYRALLEAAANREELPGPLSDSKRAYEVVGRLTVERSDILVAVWDGQPAAGRGGTPEIIEFAVARRIPVVWIDAGCDRRPRVLHQSLASGPSATTLAALAKRSPPVSMAGLAALAKATCRWSGVGW